MPCKTVVSIAASCPIAPAGDLANPVGTSTGPVVVAAGTASTGAGVAAGVPALESSGSTSSMGAAATASR